MEDIRRVILQWNGGTTLTASLEEGWTAPDRALAELLNSGWPLRNRARRPGDDVLSRVAREVARIFNARLLETGCRSGGDAHTATSV
jgi:hypothetical protein